MNLCTLSFLLHSCRVVYHLPPGYFFNRPCGNQMGNKFLEVVCDEHGIGGSGEYCGDNDAHLGCICQHQRFLTRNTC
jgi:hypothetical protein